MCIMQRTTDELVSLGGGGGGGEGGLASTYANINLSVNKFNDKEGLGVRRRIKITVKSTYQSSIHVEYAV